MFQTAYDGALAGPEQDRILIKTNSGRQNTGEEPASCSHLHSCFLCSGSVEGVSGPEKHSGRSLGKEARSLTAGGPVYPCGQVWPRASPGRSATPHCLMQKLFVEQLSPARSRGCQDTRHIGWMDFWPSWHSQLGEETRQSVAQRYGSPPVLWCTWEGFLEEAAFQRRLKGRAARYTKQLFIVYVKFEFHWTSCIFIC